MIHRQRPAVADTTITHLSEPNDLRHFLGVSTSCEELHAVGYALATALPRRLVVARCVFNCGKTLPRFFSLASVGRQ